MKNLFIFLCVISVCLSLTSCAREVDGGFPNRVYFPKEGGSKNYTGEMMISVFEVGYYDAYDVVYSKKQEDGSLSAVYDWLTVKSPHKGSTEIQFIAEPNLKNKKRKLFVDINRGRPEYAGIVIIQE